MCETDYPHSDSTWPNCIDVARDTMKDLPERVQYKLLRGNAERLYRFTPAEPPVLAKCLIAWRELGGQERHRHRRGFGRRPGIGAALRARRAPGSSSPTSTLDNAKETVREIEAAGGTAIAVGVDVSDEQQVQAMIAAAVDQYGRLDILVQQRRHPDAAARFDLRGAHARGLQPPGRGEPRRGVPRMQARGAAVQGARATAASSSTRLRWRDWWDGAARSTAPPRAGSSSSPAAVAIEAAPFGIRVNAICPAAMPLTGFMAAGGLDVDEAQQAADRRNGRRTAPARPRHHRRGLRRGRAVPGVGCLAQRHRSGAAHRRWVRGQMTTPTLDRDRLRELFDLRSSYNEYIGGNYHDDPYPIWHRLREQGPVLPGILHELTGCTDPMYCHGLPYPDRPHFTMFDYETCFTAYRNRRGVRVLARTVRHVQRTARRSPTACCRWAAPSTSATAALVQSSFLPANGKWWAQTGSPRPWTLLDRRVRPRRTRRTQRRLLRRHPASHHHRQLRRARRAGARDSGRRSDTIRRRSSTSSGRSSPPAAKSRRTT